MKQLRNLSILVVKFISNIFSEKNTVQDTALEISKDDKFEELNEKKKEKRQRDENNEKERDSCVSFFSYCYYSTFCYY